MYNLSLKHLFNKSVHSVWNSHFLCRQRSGTDLLSKIYVVVQGRKPGIYSSWEECELQVTNFKGMRFKKFSNKDEALLYLDKSINFIEEFQPKKKKSVKELKKILNQYREKWKHDNKDVEATQCKSLKNSETEIIHSSRFHAIYNSVDADKLAGDLACTLVNASDNSSETGVDSFHLERESERELETHFDSDFFTNSENEKHENFCIIYNGISYNNENYKEVKNEFYLCKNMLEYLEENVTDNNTEIYEAFRSLGREQQAEFETKFSSQFSEACRNLEKEERKVFSGLDLNSVMGKICSDGEENSFIPEAPNVCTSTFSEENTDEDEYPPYLFELEKNRESEIKKIINWEYNSFENRSTCPKKGESVVDGYLELYTDGACYNNGKENSYGAVGIYFGRRSKLNTSVMLEGKVTNNIAEIRAAYIGLQIAHENGFSKVKLYTDSDYVVKCCNKWLRGWKKSNWKKANGRPVLNKEELIYLEEAIAKMDDVELIHVKGHIGIEGNEYADKLARDCALASRGGPNEDVY